MTTRKLFKTLRKLQSYMQANHPYINYGGCCVYAAMIAEKLQALGLEVEVITPVFGRYYQNASVVRKLVKNVAIKREWNDNGLSTNHLAVRFKTKAGHIYTYDSDALIRGSTFFSNEMDMTDPKFGTGLTVKEAKAFASKQDGWNRTFDRRSIPAIRRKVNEEFAALQV